LLEAALQQARHAVLHFDGDRIPFQLLVVRPGGQISSASRLRSTARLVGSREEVDFEAPVKTMSSAMVMEPATLWRCLAKRLCMPFLFLSVLGPHAGFCLPPLSLALSLPWPSGVSLPFFIFAFALAFLHGCVAVPSLQLHLDVRLMVLHLPLGHELPAVVLGEDVPFARLTSTGVALLRFVIKAFRRGAR
jgi:hypothetical protein